MRLPLALALALAACSGRGRAGPPVEGALTFPAPAADSGRVCADVGGLRACWGCASGTCVVPRPLPARPAPPAGWRCQGQGEGRTCLDRAAGGGPFTCEGDVCEQRHPRVPDDGVWECVDLDGAVVCRGGEASAGVVPAGPDPGWICGRRLADAKTPTICVDLSPDLPGGVPTGWRCKFDHTRGLRRSCRRDPRAPALGGPCPCPAGVACVEGRCVPASAPAADCWLPADCGTGARCRYGTCEGA